MAINYNPTTSKNNNAPDTYQLDLTTHPKWDNQDPPKGHVHHYQFILTHNTASNGPHLTRHPVPHQYCTHYRYLGNKLTHPTNRNGTGGRIQMHEGGILPPTSQGLSKAKYNNHSQNTQHIVVAPAGRSGKLCHPDRGY